MSRADLEAMLPEELDFDMPDGAKWRSAWRKVSYIFESQSTDQEKALDLARQHRRRARIRKSGGVFTQEQWRDLCARHDNKCLCCGKVGRMTIDHVVPLAKGGSNDISNIQPLCLRCNLSKGTKVIDYR
jgi:5-methylcytosine-specific restriction endonuclease McrA